MSLSQENIETIISLWKYSEQQADPRSKEEDIVSGLRARPLIACQYWVKGLGTICSYWNGKKCSYKIKPNDSPSGYNGGNCDYLGRRDTCDRYDGTTDIENYGCIAPNIFLSGLGKVAGKSDEGYKYSPIPIADIKGYCEGKCDGYGRGTGCGGIPDKDPVICNYYRPWQMGFGSVEPRQVKDAITSIAIDGTITIDPNQYQKLLNDVFDPMVKRLPFSFEVYNLRAEFQKCAYWNSDSGAYFGIDKYGYVELEEDSEELCTCTDLLARQHCTIANSPPEGTQSWLLQSVWSEAGSVICNGAKPECPFYTGEWVYCDDLHMVTGMRITANQIFELRFWTAQWGSQAEYDSFFESKPNWQDVPTADIYIFKKWQKLGQTAADSVAEGQILHMCQPAPINDRRFVPSIFLSAKDIQYTAAGVNAGTTDPADGGVYFPTLIRDLSLTSDIWYIDIVYPYASVNPFSSEVCNKEINEDPLCIKRSSSINGDTISVIGTTTRNKTVYVFNLNLLDGAPSEFNDHWNIYTISDIKTTTGRNEGNYTGFSPRQSFFEKLENFLDAAVKSNNNAISKVVSNDETGVFKAGPLDLNYGEINKIVICVKFTDTIWDFRIRPVLSKWYGGFLIQNSFIQEGSGQGLPKNFYPNAEITGKILPLIDGGKTSDKIESKCSLGNIIHTTSNIYQNANYGVNKIYTYCYRQITVEGKKIINWTRIGNSGLIWVELEDTNINYIFEWGIIDAKMSSAEEQIDMANVQIEPYVTGEKSIPPSACFLMPMDSSVKKMFFNDDWSLEISYWYNEISNDNSAADNVEVLPDFSKDGITFVDSTLNVDFDGDAFTIDNINNQTVALMGLFAEEDGRIIASMATKMLVQVSMLECRNIEIFYRYQQPAQWYILKPETSMSSLATPPFYEVCQGEYAPRIYTPPCGDHENGFGGLGNGPMWYPFNTCGVCDFYQAWASGGYCTNWFQCAGKVMRFCGPTKYTAFVEPGGGSVYADCVLSFHYRYSVTTGEATFSGRANIVAYVDVLEYTLNGWTLPPFGNKGREMVIKWISQDNWIYLSSKGIRPYVTNQWIPLVPDLTDFFTSFNSFSESSVINPNSFMHINQLSFFKSDLIEEEVGTERKRFDEVFGSRGLWAASYPPSALQPGVTNVVHYYFKDPSTVWAWRELWEDISYPNNERNFYFLTYEKPDYVYDGEKLEHRYICDEGIYSIKYTAPIMEEGEVTVYPSLQLGNGPTRFFDITDGSWKDEGSGNVDGSVEDGEEENIYEVTSPTVLGSKWSHDKDCLFDDEAVRTYEAAEAAGRNIGEDSYYNRGLIFNLGSLNYLPYEEIDCAPGLTVSPESNIESGMGTYYWDNIAPSIVVDLVAENVGSCISELVIEGFWGNHDIQIDSVVTKRNVCIPEIIVIEEYGDGETRTLTSKAEIAFDKDVYGEIGVVPYTITFELQPTVDRMINKQATSMEISLDCSISQYIYLQSVGFKSAMYVDSTESIQVYERMYITSIASNLGDHNINGPKVDGNFVLQNDWDRDNSGTYYSIHPQINCVPEGAINAKDKMRSVYASQQYIEDESLEINIGNISEIEQREQQELYNNAYARDVDGDTTKYSSVLPPAFSKFFSDHNIQINFLESLTFTTTKAKWDDHYLQSYYTPGGMWYPGGHKFQWSKYIVRMQCYYYIMTGGTINYIPGMEIGSVDFLHIDYGAAVSVSDPFTAFYVNRVEYRMSVSEKLAGLGQPHEDIDLIVVGAGFDLGSAMVGAEVINIGALDY